MEKQTTGVVITLREIYDSVQNVGDSLKRMEEKLVHLEEKSLRAVKADESSREALNISREAYKLAKESSEAIQSYERSRNQQRQWFIRTLIAAVIPYVVSCAIGLFYMFGK
ncbi:hypothetical protein [Priestia koreensis]|uniref:Uncharacterized protein n=1 Tax=Priestia koreensis TaxID=284581 RepID=A0A0M0LBE5_9BACI|nr:hypothetical protein [Priestia koreensis]KOO48182.1 hypothetical protein AMD01_05110 [Priestia koreensis]